MCLAYDMQSLCFYCLYTAGGKEVRRLILNKVQEGIMGRYVLWVKEENITQSSHDFSH